MRLIIFDLNQSQGFVGAATEKEIAKKVIQRVTGHNYKANVRAKVDLKFNF